MSVTVNNLNERWKEVKNSIIEYAQVVTNSRNWILEWIGWTKKKSIDVNLHEKTQDATYLQETDYYEKYNSFYDLNCLYETINSMDISHEIVDTIKNKQDPITLLTLGSATPENINWLAKIDTYFRGKEKVENDRVIIIDVNQKSVDIHQKRIDQLDALSDWSKTIEREESKKHWFHYPQYTVALWDMRNLHYTDRSINIIVSDYTLNYLYSIEDIKKTFSEVNRLLTADGIFIVSLEYSKRSLISQWEKEIKQGNIGIHRFQLNEYITAAENNNMIQVAAADYPSHEDGKITIVFRVQKNN